jgi:hypothetical protein
MTGVTAAAPPAAAMLIPAARRPATRHRDPRTT